MDSYLVCFHCSKKFKTRATIKRHIFRDHNPNGIRQTFECPKCSKKFPTKFSMQRHNSQIHQSDTSRRVVECTICHKTYARDDLLQRHIQAYHGSNQNSKLSAFECAHCDLTFAKSRHRIEHIRLCHPNDLKRPLSKFTRLKCLKCGDLFLTKKELNDHYTSQHSITLIFDRLQFSSFQNFEEWLENVKRQTITNFVVSHRYRTSTKLSNLQLICHRSRGYSDMLKEDERKRSLKISGYKGLDGYCPSEIKVTQFDDGTCSVLYQKTHVGHEVGDKTELKHIYLSKSQKLKIASKIQSGVSVNQIRKQELLSKAENESMDRLDLLNNHDIRNIAAKYKMNVVNSRRTRLLVDSSDTEIFLEENRDKILFYKWQGIDDFTYQKLEKDDFAIVIMDETYANYLRLYGDKVIAMANTRMKNLHDFNLHTLLVLDNEEEGLPIAFLISNRNDRAVVDIFISCIRDRVGVIETRTLITDLQLTYYDSWSDLMAPPQIFLFCFWRVCEAWRLNCGKLVSKGKRTSLMESLLDLAREPNMLAFEQKLASFLTVEDADTQPFIEYFKESFSNNINCWAYCFRQDAGINTNIYIDMFHRNLEKSFAQYKEIETIGQCLVYILECLMMKQAEILQKQIKGKVTLKLSVLRNRHRAAYSVWKSGDERIEVTPIDSSTFLVASSQNDEFNSYTVRRNERKTCTSDNETPDCNLLCLSCNICYHEFCCSCQDYSMKNNMCQHIHWLGLWLRNNMVKSEDEEIESIFVNDPLTDLVTENEVNIADTVDDDSSIYWREKVTSILPQLACDISTMSAEQMEVVYTKFLVNITSDMKEETKD